MSRRVAFVVVSACIVGCSAILGLPADDPTLEETVLDAGRADQATGLTESGSAETGPVDGGDVDAESPVDGSATCDLTLPTSAAGVRCPPVGDGATCANSQQCCVDDQLPLHCFKGDGSVSCKLNYPRLDCEYSGHCIGASVCCLVSVADQDPCTVRAARTTCKLSCANGEVELCSLKDTKCSNGKTCTPRTVVFPSQLGSLVEGMCL